jgi:hypothetical protein
MLKKDAGRDAFKYSQSTACATHSGLPTCVKLHSGVARELFFLLEFFRYGDSYNPFLAIKRQRLTMLFALRMLGDWGRESSLY